MSEPKISKARKIAAVVLVAGCLLTVWYFKPASLPRTLIIMGVWLFPVVIGTLSETLSKKDDK